MATLDDLKGVLESIDRSMVDQKTLLTNMFNLQQTTNRLSSVNTSIVPEASTGQSVGAAVEGIGTGVGAAAAGLGIGGLAGLAGLAMFANFDAQAVKDNVVTLLSIADEVGGKVEILKEGGTFFLAMSGLGIGLAAFGIGQTLVGLGQWITDDQWTQTLKSNVVDLLSIADEAGGNLSMLFEGGALTAALFGIGWGLKSFGVGQALVGLGQWITDDTWAEQVKSNVLTLLSIGEEIPENVSALDESGAFFFAMSGLGAGLAVFSIGQAAAGLAQFISSDDWAQKVKDNVITLLSISELDGIGWNTAGFIGVMGGIAAGLAAFSIGKGGAVVVDGAAEALKYFTGDSFADKIKSEVETLLSIPQMEGVGANTTGFIGVMAGIATGLAAFALGKGAATVIDGATEALAYFTSDKPFADKIKSEVETLLSIVGLAPEGSVDEFTNIMSKLGDGLSSFAGGNFVGALKNVGTAILGFFSGQDSPFEQIRMIASDADNLVKAANAIEKIANSLEKFGSIDVNVGDVDFEKLAANLGASLPLLNALANGGKVGEGIFDGPEIDFGKGILDSSLKLDEMAEAISKVNYVLGQTTEYPLSMQESAASAVAESSIASPETEQLRLEKEIEAIKIFAERVEVISGPTSTARSGEVASVDIKGGAIDARTFVGGATNTTVIMPRSASDLDYGLPRMVR